MNTESNLYRELTENELKAIVETSLHTDQLAEATLLDGGMFNTTYKICYGERKQEAVLQRLLMWTEQYTVMLILSLPPNG